MSKEESIYQNGFNESGFKKIEDELKNIERPNSFYMNRALARSQHRKGITEGRKGKRTPEAVQLELFEGLSKMEKKVAVPLSGKTFANEIISTIPTSGLTAKVLIALGQTIHEQSNKFKDENTDYTKRITTKSGKEKEVNFTPLRGINETALDFFPHLQGVPSPIQGEGALPNIIIDITEFTKLVNGRMGENYTPSGAERNEIKDILENLKQKEVIMFINGNRLAFPLLNLIAKDLGSKKSEGNNGKRELWALALSPVFYNGITQDHIRFRADILKDLKGNQSEMTMRLLWLLGEFFSYGHSLTLTKRRAELFEEIAVLKRYTDHKKARDEDFRKAIETMKRLRLLSSYTEKEGANGELISVFKLNKNYLTEE